MIAQPESTTTTTGILRINTLAGYVHMNTMTKQIIIPDHIPIMEAKP